MTIINCALTLPIEASFEVSDKQLDVMASSGVDIDDEEAVAAFYRKHIGETIDEVKFRDLQWIADHCKHTSYEPEIYEWWGETS